jgi:hypothetical protein
MKSHQTLTFQASHYCFTLLRVIRWLFVLACFLLVTTAFADVALAEKGKSRYRIVVPEGAIPSERHAAEELQRYVETMSGATLPIVTDTGKPASRDILLGDNAHSSAASRILMCCGFPSNA